MRKKWEILNVPQRSCKCGGEQIEFLVEFQCSSSPYRSIYIFPSKVQSLLSSVYCLQSKVYACVLQCVECRYIQYTIYNLSISLCIYMLKSRVCTYKSLKNNRLMHVWIVDTLSTCLLVCLLSFFLSLYYSLTDSSIRCAAMLFGMGKDVSVGLNSIQEFL